MTGIDDTPPAWGRRPRHPHVVDLLADRAPGLRRALREADPGYVLLDDTLAECDRVDDTGPTSPTSTADTG